MTQQEREVSRRDQGGYSTGRTEIAQKIVSTRKIVEAKLTLRHDKSDTNLVQVIS